MFCEVERFFIILPAHLVAMNPKAENSCAVRRAKFSKKTAPSKSEKQFSNLTNYKDFII